MSHLGSFLSDSKQHETALTEPRPISTINHLFFSAFNPLKLSGTSVLCLLTLYSVICEDRQIKVLITSLCPH
jgi:hypothetical protein